MLVLLPAFFRTLQQVRKLRLRRLPHLFAGGAIVSGGSQGAERQVLPGAQKLRRALIVSSRQTALCKPQQRLDVAGYTFRQQGAQAFQPAHVFVGAAHIPPGVLCGHFLCRCLFCC